MNMKKSCLVVIDMINGFIFEGALSDRSIDTISGNVIELIEEYSSKGLPILNFQDAHQTNAKEFDVFPPHCLAGTSESELIDSLKPFQDKMITLYKNSTNGFMQPQFLDTFKKLDCTEFVCVGCCTDICVFQFVLSLQGYINENNLGVRVVVVENSVETFNSPVHDQSEYNQMAFTLLGGAGIVLVKTHKEIINEL